MLTWLPGIQVQPPAPTPPLPRLGGAALLRHGPQGPADGRAVPDRLHRQQHRPVQRQGVAGTAGRGRVGGVRHELEVLPDTGPSGEHSTSTSVNV